MIRDLVLGIGAGLAAGELLLGAHWLWQKRDRLRRADLAGRAERVAQAVQRRIVS